LKVLWQWYVIFWSKVSVRNVYFWPILIQGHRKRWTGFETAIT
jgi:hypothetical protein